MIIPVPRRKVVDENDHSRRDGDLHLSPVEAPGPRAGPGSVTPGMAVILDIKGGITDAGIPVLENGHTNTSMVAARSEIEEGMVTERGGIARVNLVGSRETIEVQGEFRLPNLLGFTIYIHTGRHWSRYHLYTWTRVKYLPICAVQRAVVIRHTC